MQSASENRLAIAAAVVIAASISTASFATAQTLDTMKGEPIGKAEFIKNCAVCHGREGKGDGPLSDQLAKRPSALTTIAKRNNGAFPSEEIYRLIDGRQMLSAHGTRDMPVWGDRYFAKSIEEFWPWGSEQVVKGRILELVFYLQSIQER